MALHPPPLQNAEKIQQRALMTTQKKTVSDDVQPQKRHCFFLEV
jgi:hypothetical protein